MYLIAILCAMFPVTTNASAPNWKWMFYNAQEIHAVYNVSTNVRVQFPGMETALKAICQCDVTILTLALSAFLDN